MPVYFCDSRSSWQRGSNENANGLLRDYFSQRPQPCTPSTRAPTRSRRRTQRPAPHGSPRPLPGRSIHQFASLTGSVGIATLTRTRRTQGGPVLRNRRQRGYGPCCAELVGKISAGQCPANVAIVCIPNPSGPHPSDIGAELCAWKAAEHRRPTRSCASPSITSASSMVERDCGGTPTGTAVPVHCSDSPGARDSPVAAHRSQPSTAQSAQAESSSFPPGSSGCGGRGRDRKCAASTPPPPSAALRSSQGEHHPVPDRFRCGDFEDVRIRQPEAGVDGHDVRSSEAGTFGQLPHINTI